MSGFNQTTIGTIEERRDLVDGYRWRFSCRRAPLARYRGPWRTSPKQAIADREAFVRNTIRALSMMVEHFAAELLEEELAAREEAA